MQNIPLEPQQKGEIANLKYSSSPYQSPLSSPYQTPSYVSNEQEATLPSSLSRISPLILLVIIVLAVIFFIYGLVHLVLWFLMKRPSPSLSLYNSNRFPSSESTRTRALQRQLQQLFRMHDSGLDQSLIDSLPVFYYQDLLGLKEPFDCAVCLCEFSDEDKLRLVPICSHAFHMSCLDTWLLSNSTCPLCRATLSTSTMENQNPMFSVVENSWVGRGTREEESNVCSSHGQVQVNEDEQGFGKRVFSVRLGKFRSSGIGEVLEGGGGSSSSSSCGLDGRRCYSMGSYQYVVRDSNLQVVLSQSHDEIGDEELGVMSNKGYLCDASENGDVDGKKIGNNRTKGESFSVSKIWLWSKKSKYHGSNAAFP